MSKIRKQKSFKGIIPTTLIALLIIGITYSSSLDFLEKGLVIVLALLAINIHILVIIVVNNKIAKERLKKMGGDGKCTTIVPTFELRNVLGSTKGELFAGSDKMNYVTGAEVPHEFRTGDKTKCTVGGYKKGLCIEVQAYSKARNAIAIPYDTITGIRVVEENIREGLLSAEEAYRKNASIDKYSQKRALAAAMDATNKKVRISDVFSIIETIYGEKIYLLMEEGTQEQVNELKHFYNKHTGLLDKNTVGVNLPK